MTEKEIGEIRRRFRSEKSNITCIRGCYVNDKKEIVTEFNQSLATMSQDESDEMLSVLKKTLSGSIDKNLLNIEFETKQVMDGEEHKLLMSLRNSSLNDDNAVKVFFEKVISSINMEDNYLIILACDNYDVPSFAKDGEKLDSTDTFSYIICSICPIKLTKPALGYYPGENLFKNISVNWLVSTPQLGFMFPTFEDRCSNIYNALYYTRDVSQNHDEFVDAIFKSELPMPAELQKETFQSILSETVADDCNYDVVQAVHEEISQMIEEHKINKEEEPLTISKRTVKVMLKSCGVNDEKVNSFEKKYDSEFGENTKISPKNIVDVKKFEVFTPDVKIHVNPERSDLVQTRVIDGVKYILIAANEGVEVNGVHIHINE